MSSVTVSSTAAPSTPSIRPSHTVDQVSISTTPANSSKNFLYALIGFTVLSLAAGAAYELWHRRSDGRDHSRANTGDGNSSGQPSSSQ